MTSPDLAATLAGRLIPGDAELQAELAGRIRRRPAVLAQAEADMDAAERAMVREAIVYLRASADAAHDAVRSHTPPKRAA